MRTFKDSEGRIWRVWHVVPQSDVLRASSPDLAGGWLCFEYDGDKRRLVNPPERWHESTDHELHQLFTEAVPVKKAEMS